MLVALMPSDFDGSRLREIKLERLDGTALRRIAGETDQISWFLKIDRISEELRSASIEATQKFERMVFPRRRRGPPRDG